MMRDLLIERLKELKQLQKERETYDNLCTNQIVGSYNLQSSLSTLQKPTIDALAKLKPEAFAKPPIETKNEETSIKTKIEETPIETKTEKAEVIPPKILLFLSDEKTLPLKITLPNKFYFNNITKSITPVVSLIDVNGKFFLEIIIKKNRLYFYKKDQLYYFLIYDEGGEIEDYPYNRIIIDLIYGDIDLEEKYGHAEKKYMHIYLDLVGANTRNINYCKKLKEIAGIGKMKEKAYKSAENITVGKGYPINLFEKLALLISAVKAGHNGLEEDIKMVCKKLKIDDLISQEVYEKYKEKYFS